MPVSKNDVEYIAALAKLEFTEAEKETLTHQLNEILVYVEQLNRLDTSAVEPLTQMVDSGNRFRDDRVTPGLSPEEVLQNAPSRTDKFFKVPKVIGEKGTE